MADKYIEELFAGYCPYTDKFCPYTGKECKYCEIEQNERKVIEYFMKEGYGDGGE